MRRIAITALLIICACQCIMAQTFIQGIEKQNKGQGSVRVSQSADIDAVVNGKKSNNKAKKETGKPNTSSQHTTQAHKLQTPSVNIKQQSAPSFSHSTIRKENVTNTHVSELKTTRHRTAMPNYDDDYDPNIFYKTLPDGRTVRMKRVLVTKKKVNGFRVQVYSGGNTRNDRQQAEIAGQKVKAILPDQPVYVHFYSPRWMCQVGNFTTQRQAVAVLRKVRKIGFKQAIIIRCKVTVNHTKNGN